MEKKAILQELCSTLEKQLNEQPNEQQGIVLKRTVGFFSGPKPLCVTTEIRTAWYIEISVDGKVVYRDSYLPEKIGDFEGVEELLAGRVLADIFRFGVMSCKDIIDKRAHQGLY